MMEAIIEISRYHKANGIKYTKSNREATINKTCKKLFGMDLDTIVKMGS
jgi:hypothetical protein